MDAECSGIIEINKCATIIYFKWKFASLQYHRNRYFLFWPFLILTMPSRCLLLSVNILHPVIASFCPTYTPPSIGFFCPLPLPCFPCSCCPFTISNIQVIQPFRNALQQTNREIATSLRNKCNKIRNYLKYGISHHTTLSSLSPADPQKWFSSTISFKNS